MNAFILFCNTKWRLVEQHDSWCWITNIYVTTFSGVNMQNSYLFFIRKAGYLYGVPYCLAWGDTYLLGDAGRGAHTGGFLT